MNVAFVGQLQYYDCSIPDKLKGVNDILKIQVNGDFGHPENHEILLNVEDIDVWFFFRGEFLHKKYADQLKGVKVNISTEPIQRADTPYCLKQTKDKFDFSFHYDKTHIEWIKKQGVHVDGDFQLPVNLEVYYPAINTVAFNELQTWDVGFIGRSTDSRERHFDMFTPRREKYMGVLKHLKKFLHISHGMYGEELVEIINRIRNAWFLHN